MLQFAYGPNNGAATSDLSLKQLQHPAKSFLDFQLSRYPFIHICIYKYILY